MRSPFTYRSRRKVSFRNSTVPVAYGLHHSYVHHERKYNLLHAILGIEISWFSQLLTFALQKMPSVFGFQEVRSKDISPIFFQYGTKSKLCWTLSPDAYYNQDNMTTSGRQAFYDWWEQQQGKCLIFQRNSWNTAWWMLTFLQRCCAQFKKNTQSLEHVNLFQEAIPFASRQFSPTEIIYAPWEYFYHSQNGIRPSATIFNETLSLAILDESQR